MRKQLILALTLVALDIARASADGRNAALLQGSVSNETQGQFRLRVWNSYAYSDANHPTLTLKSCTKPHLSSFAGENWALLIAGSNGWGNYRHQADVAHVGAGPSSRERCRCFSFNPVLHSTLPLSPSPFSPGTGLPGAPSRRHQGGQDYRHDVR